MRRIRLWDKGYTPALLGLFNKKSLAIAGGAVLLTLPVAVLAQNDVPQPTHIPTTPTNYVPPVSSKAAVEPSEPLPNTTNVTVNGQSVPVPDNGAIHQTIPSDNGQTNVDISSQNTQTTTGNGTSHSSMSVQINSSSHSSNEEIIDDSP